MAVVLSANPRRGPSSVARRVRMPLLLAALLAATRGAISELPPPRPSPYAWPRERTDAHNAARLRNVSRAYTKETRQPCVSSVPAVVGAGCASQRSSNCSTPAAALDAALEARVWRECWGAMSMLAVARHRPIRATQLLRMAQDFIRLSAAKREPERPLLRDLAARPPRRFAECAVTSGLYPANESDIPALDARLTGTRGPLIRPNHMCARSIEPEYSAGKRPPFHRRHVDISVINGGVNTKRVCGACHVDVPIPRTGLALLVRPLDKSSYLNARKCLNASQPGLSMGAVSAATMRLGFVLSAAFSDRDVSQYPLSDHWTTPKVSTGFLAVVFALLHCERVVLYGFGGPVEVEGHLIGYSHDLLAERRAVAALSAPKHERSQLVQEVLTATGARAVQLVF